jgi:hypothetical protein
MDIGPSLWTPTYKRWAELKREHKEKGCWVIVDTYDEAPEWGKALRVFVILAGYVASNTEN